MFKDEHRCEVWEQFRQQDLRAFARLLPQSLFAEAAEQAGVRIVCSALAIPNLVWLGILAAAHSTKSATTVAGDRIARSIVASRPILSAQTNVENQAI